MTNFHQETIWKGKTILQNANLTIPKIQFVSRKITSRKIFLDFPAFGSQKKKTSQRKYFPLMEKKHSKVRKMVFSFWKEEDIFLHFSSLHIPILFNFFLFYFLIFLFSMNFCFLFIISFIFYFLFFLPMSIAGHRWGKAQACGQQR